MTTYMYCLYVGVDYTYIDINALNKGIKSFLVSQMGTFRPIVSMSIYVCMHSFMYVCNRCNYESKCKLYHQSRISALSTINAKRFTFQC